MVKFPETESTAPPDFARDVVKGLSQDQKQIPSRWLYDEEGASLFEEITRLEEYYPTRTEIRILKEHRGELAAFLNAPAVLMEYGSGASRKTRILLDALPDGTVYVPIDISREMLQAAAVDIALRYPGIAVVPVMADFMHPFALPAHLPAGRRIAFFPGSTIGNLDEQEAAGFLQRMGQQTGPDGKAVIGFDLRKDVAVLLAAYDDSRGVTAAFNKNLLKRINRELDADFDLSAFTHEARWNEAKSRIEMHLVSGRRQKVRVGSHTFAFALGETIHTESSHKYGVTQFAGLARRAGWQVERVWTDSAKLFALAGLVRRP